MGNALLSAFYYIKEYLGGFDVKPSLMWYHNRGVATGARGGNRSPSDFLKSLVGNSTITSCSSENVSLCPPPTKIPSYPYIAIIIFKEVFIFPLQSPKQWQVVFLTMGSISLLGIVIFVTCASGEIQPWASYKIDVGEDELEIRSEKLNKSIEPVVEDLETRR